MGVNETLTVHLEMICDCDCERPGSSESFETNSPQCGNHGNLNCGICNCEKGFFGKKCECNVNDRGLSNVTESVCRAEKDTVDCSGRGRCECNECNCYSRLDPNEVTIIVLQSVANFFNVVII